MIRKRLFPMALSILAACLAASAAEAQRGGWVAGISGGPSVVSEDDADFTALRPHIRASIGRRLSDAITVGLEATAFGLFDETPTQNDLIADSIFLFRPEVVGTQTLMATVQIDLSPVFYIRPGVGIGRHAFPAYLVGPDNRVDDAYVSHEAGLAAGLTVGHEVEIGRVPVGIEGVLVRSQGEDSSNPRWIYGLNVGPRFTF